MWSGSCSLPATWSTHLLLGRGWASLLGLGQALERGEEELLTPYLPAKLAFVKEENIDDDDLTSCRLRPVQLLARW